MGNVSFGSMSNQWLISSFSIIVVLQSIGQLLQFQKWTAKIGLVPEVIGQGKNVHLDFADIIRVIANNPR
jgi:hypothetical protein